MSDVLGGTDSHTHTRPVSLSYLLGGRIMDARLLCSTLLLSVTRGELIYAPARRLNVSG